jgi:hypothetical protein
MHAVDFIDIFEASFINHGLGAPWALLGRLKKQPDYFV